MHGLTPFAHMHFRYYASTMGRFMKPDNMITNAANPQSWNLYSYCNGNPVNFNDPTGHAASKSMSQAKLAPPGGSIWDMAMGSMYSYSSGGFYVSSPDYGCPVYTSVNQEGYIGMVAPQLYGIKWVTEILQKMLTTFLNGAENVGDIGELGTALLEGGHYTAQIYMENLAWYMYETMELMRLQDYGDIGINNIFYEAATAWYDIHLNALEEGKTFDITASSRDAIIDSSSLVMNMKQEEGISYRQLFEKYIDISFRYAESWMMWFEKTH